MLRNSLKDNEKIRFRKDEIIKGVFKEVYNFLDDKFKEIYDNGKNL